MKNCKPKTVLSILLVSSILFAQPVFAQTPQTPAPPAKPVFFTDVPENHLSYPAIQELKNLNILKGYPDNTFRPENPISRAEAVSLLLKITNKTGAYSSEKTYTDVPKEQWFFADVQRASELKIVSGYPDSTFHPLDPVKLNEATKILFLAFGLPVLTPAPSEPWYLYYLKQAFKKNLFDEDPLLTPDKKMTRGEFAKLIWRAKKVKDTAGTPFDITLEWKTFKNEENYFELKYPRDWEAFKANQDNVFWKTDTENGQIWFVRLFPKSIRVSVHFQEAAKCKNSAGEELVRRYDGNICLKNGKALTVYGDYGFEVNPDYAKKTIKMIIDGIRYTEPKPPSPPPLTPEQKVEKAREQILILGKGPDIFKMFPDKKLIETDAIGVGTGPVDYFYSKEANITIKYERNSKTILDIKNGETSKF